MKMDDFLTIHPLDYKLAKCSLALLPKEAALVFEKMIRDHMAVCEHQELFLAVLANLHGTLFDENLGRDIQPAAERGEDDADDGVDDDSDDGEVDTDDKDSDEGETPNSSDEPAPKPKPGPKKHEPKLSATYHHSIGPCDCSLCGSAMVRGRTVNRTVILAKPLLVAERHQAETRRCLTCNTTAQAETPPEHAHNIGRYAPSAVASLAGLRYLFGMPSLRIELLCGTMGLRVSDSTQWHLFEEAASRLRPFRLHLEKVVANAPLKHFDDTGVVILSLREAIREKQEQALAEGKNPDSVRSGLHTSVTCAVLPELGRIAIFNSGLHHCGEIIGSLLKKRTTTETVILMADAANANTSRLPKDAPFKIINANCNSHAVRRFKDLRESFPEPAAFFEQAYAQVFRNDALSREKGLSAAERLAMHREHSRPLMDGMKSRALSDFDKRLVEPNSMLGKTYKYFLNQFDRLVAFCEHEGAPVCNNLAERMLKPFIRQRKASLFFKNDIGAAVADILSTLLITAHVNGLNPVKYVETMLLNPDVLRAEPDAFLPWNFAARFSPDDPPKTEILTKTE